MSRHAFVLGPDEANPYAAAFGALAGQVEELLAGHQPVSALGERLAEIREALEQRYDPDGTEALPLPGESRKGDTAGARKFEIGDKVTISPDITSTPEKVGTVVEVIPPRADYHQPQYYGLDMATGGIFSADQLLPAEVPPAQSGEATA